MKRRTILTSGTSAAALVLAGRRTFAVAGPDWQQRSTGPRFADLNPDRMWPVYRRYHLLIVGQRDDESGSALAAATVDVLVATDQQDVAIMAAGSAEALFLGKPPFDDIRDAPLRVIVSLGSHSLVCRPSFMARHAYLIARTLAEHKEAFLMPAGAPDGVVPAHRGSHAFFAGEEVPDD